MKTSFLFPHAFKTVGWLLFVPAFLACLYISLSGVSTDDVLQANVFALVNDGLMGGPKYCTMISNGILDELLLFCLVIGGIFICFSRLKEEDEFIARIRHESLVWAVYVNYGIILLLTVLIYGLPYLTVLFFNTFTLILFFIIRFHFKLYQLKKDTRHEE